MSNPEESCVFQNPAAGKLGYLVIDEKTEIETTRLLCGSHRWVSSPDDPGRSMAEPSWTILECTLVKVQMTYACPWTERRTIVERRFDEKQDFEGVASLL